jgi:hypothetical protein
VVGSAKGDRLVRPGFGELVHRASTGWKWSKGGMNLAGGRQDATSRGGRHCLGQDLSGGHVAVGLVGLASDAAGGVEVGPLLEAHPLASKRWPARNNRGHAASAAELAAGRVSRSDQTTIDVHAHQFVIRVMPVIGGFLQKEFCAVKWLCDDRNAAMRAVRTGLLLGSQNENGKLCIPAGR